MKRALLWFVTVTVTVFFLPNVVRAFDPNLQWLNVYGDYMDNYDMAYYDPSDLDWPVGMVWGCQGNLTDVRSYMQSSLGPGYGHVSGGTNKFVRVWESDQGGAVHWWGDSGNQTACYFDPDDGACYSGDGCMRHTRTYAPEWFYNAGWGYYVVATQHYDKNHASCVGSNSESFGWSETVESRILGEASADGYSTVAHMYYMQNSGYGWDEGFTHYHQSDGYASYVNFGSCDPDLDWDGCTNAQEAAMGFAVDNYWDFYDVPIPANDDPTPNGTRNRAVNMQDVAGVLKYVGTADNDPPNANGVDYDSTKDGDWNGDTVVTEEADQVGLRYDRSPGPLPNPPYDAGPPDGAVNFQDVVMVLNQVGLDCTGGIDGPDDADGAPSGDGDALDSAPNAMAVDAIPGGGVDPTRTVTGTAPFDVTVLITAAGSAYAGYDLTLSYDDQVLAFVPTVDLNRDTVAESWSYTGLGGMGLKARVTGSDRDGDTVVDTATGGAASSSGTSTATGAVVTGSFRCVGDGTSPLHLVAPAEAVLSTDTIAEDGGAIDTSLTDASVTCQGVQ